MFEYVVRKGGLRESEARWFFQQLIVAVDYIHRMVRLACMRCYCRCCWWPARSRGLAYACPRCCNSRTNACLWRVMHLACLLACLLVSGAGCCQPRHQAGEHTLRWQPTAADQGAPAKVQGVVAGQHGAPRLLCHLLFSAGVHGRQCCSPLQRTG